MLMLVLVQALHGRPKRQPFSPFNLLLKYCLYRKRERTYYTEGSASPWTNFKDDFIDNGDIAKVSEASTERSSECSNTTIAYVFEQINLKFSPGGVTSHGGASKKRQYLKPVSGKHVSAVVRLRSTVFGFTYTSSCTIASMDDEGGYATK